LRPSSKTQAAGVSTAFLSALEDGVALVGCVLALLVPWLPLATLLPVVLVAFLLFFYYRVRRRRGRKFGGLRILGD
jgi:membrane protein implicated in regulation of membrane protease activity